MGKARNNNLIGNPFTAQHLRPRNLKPARPRHRNASMRVKRSQNLPGPCIHTLKVIRERQNRPAPPLQRPPAEATGLEFPIVFQQTRCARGRGVAVDAHVDCAGPGVEGDCGGDLGGARGLEDDVGLAGVDVCGVDQGPGDGVICDAEVPLAPAGEFDLEIAWFAIVVWFFGVEVVVCLQDLGHDDCIPKYGFSR